MLVNSYDFNVRASPVLSYQAQLLPPPLGQLPLLERVAMHVVHRAPWNTFRHGHFFQLPKHRASVLRSPTVACAAALFRTATRTITHWPRWIEQMKVVAADNLSFSRVHGEKIFYPECWDSPPPLCAEPPVGL